MTDNEAHWYETITPSRPDRNGSVIVGGKWVDAQPGKAIYFTIIRQTNGDFFITCDKESLEVNKLRFRECTIYASQAQAMPAQVIWSIILEGINSF